MNHFFALLAAIVFGLSSAAFAADKAHFLVPPEVVVPHTPERSFIGPGMFVFENGEILMAAPWGRPPTNFEEVAAKFPVPMLYRSKDGGRTWKEQGRMRMEWSLNGLISDGGASFLRLRDGRLAVVFNRHVRGLHGGGTPVIAFSGDDGNTWTAAKALLESEDAFYVMNDRLIHLQSDRLVVPVSRKVGKTEGDRDEGLAMLSDDAGATWRLSKGSVPIEAPRGLQEPCVAELRDGRVLMLGRTGLGSIHAAVSADGAETWSAPAATTLESACSSLTLKTLPDGRLIVFYNHVPPLKPGAFFPRTPLCYAVSEDGGKSWSAPVVVDDEGVADKDRQNIYPSICFTKEGMVVFWSTHGADPKGSFKGQYDPNIGGGKRAILSLPAKALPAAAAKPGIAATIEAEVCIYGATSGGVVAAVQAARMGKKVVLVEPGKHLGGMTSGGLSAVDIGDPRTVGGLAREYFSRLVGGYGKTLEWERPHTAQGGSGHGTGGAYAIEPHRAERVFAEMAQEAGVRVLLEARLASVKKDGARLSELVLENGDVVRARVFLDTTYEGDLMARAGVGYTLMREGNAKYGESYNGIHYTASYKPRTGHLVPEANGRVKGGQGAWDRDFPLDPYVVKGDPKSGLLPLLNEGEPGTQGDPAPGVQAYCFRLCLSTAADRLPIAPPPDYNAKRYEIVARFIEACLANGDAMDLRWFSKHDEVPNQKWDFNTATFGGNLPGASHEWPEASYARRVEIAKQHENYHRGLLHFLATDPRVPKKVRDDMSRFGLPRDEFTDNGGWPHQLYIREARRMVSDLVLTEHHTHGRQVAPYPIGLGSYGTDTHEVRRIVKDGVVTREGKTAGGRGGYGPYQIGYGAIVPKAKECTNLLVTFALSASHTAFSSIRMEPVLMVVSQSAATAACLALDVDVAVQDVDQPKLQRRLLADKQILAAGGAPNAAPPKENPRAARAREVDGKSYDLVVVGGTPGGIACAVRAAREGLSVLLVNHTKHLGGFMTSGAGGWEAPWDGLRSPLYGEMLTGAMQYYAKVYGEGSQQHLLSMPSKTSRAHIDRPKLEPRIAEILFSEMVSREKTLTVLLDHVVAAAERDKGVLKRITLKPRHGGAEVFVTGGIFADAMYEGDLMAAAGVKTQVGRESTAQYGEKHAGVIYTKERHKEPGQRGFPRVADEGRLNIRYNPHSSGEILEGPNSGEADGSVMAYNYRLILTRDPANRVLVEKPTNYDPEIAKAAAGGSVVPSLPNNKAAWNGGRLIGPQNAYPEADWATRETISRRYLDAMLMRLWWLQNDPEAPQKEKENFAGYGLAADEFPDNHHLPYEIYVREARRLVGRYVFKEQDNVLADGIDRTQVYNDSIAMTDWPVDSVACLPRTTSGSSADGILFLGEESRPAQVPYRCLLTNEVKNLLVPVALSASHVGWGSIRLEPTWMQLGESAGYAAALAAKARTAPAEIESDILVRKLAASRVVVSFFNDVDVTSDDPRVPAVQYFGTKGFFAGYDAKLGEALTEALKNTWLNGFAELQAGTLDPMRLARTVHKSESASSPATAQTRGDFLLQLWQKLNASK